jgi:hypothetical protein
MLGKRKLKINYIVIAVNSCFVLILKQGMLNIRGGTAPPYLFQGAIAPSCPPSVYAYVKMHEHFKEAMN